jgi:hypothetical protein
MNTIMVLGLGVLLGMQHATEADHLAAVATMASRERSFGQGLRLGVAWGCGHTLTLLIVAGGVGLLGWVISPELAGRFEQVVGAMLLGLGANLGWRLWRERFHFHGHAHPGVGAHFHGHSHASVKGPPSFASRRVSHAADPHRHDHRMPARSLLVGMVHGLAGSAALALMVGQALPGAASQLAYIALFGLGSIVGMAMLSGAVAFSINLSGRKLTRLHRAFNGVVAALSMGLGLRLLVAWP